MKSPPSREQVWTLHYTPNKFPFASSDSEECSQRRQGRRKNQSQRYAKTPVPVPVAHRVVVTIGTAAIDRIVVPRTSTLHSEVPVPSPPSHLSEKSGYLFTISEKRVFWNPLFEKIF